MLSSTTIINAATGETLKCYSFLFSSLDEFKNYLFQEWGIPIEQQLILLPFGNKLTQDTFLSILDIGHSGDKTDGQSEEPVINNKFYLFDRKLFSIIGEPIPLPGSRILELEKLVLGEPIQSSVLEVDPNDIQFDEATLTEALKLLGTLLEDNRGPPSPSLIKPSISPLLGVDLSDPVSLNYENVKSLLITNLGWLSALNIDVRYFDSFVDQKTGEIGRMLECLGVCYQYLKTYSYELETLHVSNLSFLEQLRKVAGQSDCVSYSEDILKNIYGLGNLNLHHYVDRKSLSKNIASATGLDCRVTKDLIEVENKIKKNLQEEEVILSNIRNIRIYCNSCQADTEPEGLMLTKFEELSARLKSNSEKILCWDNSSVNSHQNNIDAEVLGIIQEDKNETVRTLHTIALALYVRAEKFGKIKKSVQFLIVLIMGQIAYSQMMCVKVKNFLLSEWNDELKQYQHYKDEISSISDLPIIYGHYLIEKYRRFSWQLQRSIESQKFYADQKTMIDAEQNEREKWNKTTGGVSFSFLNELKGDVNINFDDRSTEFANMNKLFLQLKELASFIRDYIAQLRKQGLDEGDINDLDRKFQEVSYIRPLFVESNSNPKQDRSDMELAYYKTRASNLELLLHETILSNGHHWPTGVFSNNRARKAGASLVHISSAVRNMAHSNSEEDQHLNKIDKTYYEFQIEIRKMKDEIRKLQDDLRERDTTITEQKIKISDLSLENSAYREILGHLNDELRRVVSQEQRLKSETLEKVRSHEDSIKMLVERNMEDLKKLNDVTMERDRLIQSTAALKLEKEKLERQISMLTDKVYDLERATKQQTREEGMQTEDIQTTSVTSPDDTIIRKHIGEGNLSQGQKALQQCLFDIVGGNVRILENIGLLLVSDTEEAKKEKRFSIKRVKGLSKGANDSKLGGSKSSNDAYTRGHEIKSLVFGQLEEIFNRLEKGESEEDVTLFLSYVNNIYSEYLYENSVINRFRDVEMLARNLTKENILLKKYNRNENAKKLSLDNFHVGDLALFLPVRHGERTRDNDLLLSADSHFSSVDLSTSPPSPPLQDLRRCPTRLWAAFTAFNDEEKYFLKINEESLFASRDWLVGRITSLEKHNDERIYSQAETANLVSNGTWYYVTANVVESL